MKPGLVILMLTTALLFAANLFVGSVPISFDTVWAILTGHGAEGSAERFIVIESRLPQAITAILAGAGLAVSGLMLQTAFRNPLAGPSILGINSGASLGVALVMLGFGSGLGNAVGGFGAQAAVLAGALGGSLVVMGLLLLLSMWLRNDFMLLIAGIMVGYLASSVITLLSSLSSAQGVYGYTVWGMGSFNGVPLSQLPAFGSLTIVGLLMATALIKPLNVIQLGDNYARNLGIPMRRIRNLLLCATGILTASVTAWCGPVSFIGLAVPHIARLLLRTSSQGVMVPGCMLTGATIGLACNLICVLPGSVLLPLNSVTPLIGVPVILYVILKERRRR